MKLSPGGSFTSLSGANDIITVKGKGLSQSSTFLPRDFEGVGGWRFGRIEDDDDDAQWIRINERLELPADHGRRHQRSLTGGSAPLEMRIGRKEREEGIMNTSRVRTPTSVVSSTVEGYFGTSMKTKKNSPTTTGSSGSSKGEVLSMRLR